MTRPPIDFIFMFTRADQTVEDCLEVFETVARAGVKHMGFKDIGVDFDTLVELNRRIKDAGAVSYLEVVSSTKEACLESARAARKIGVDRVMGGTEAKEILEILDGSGIDYLPFPGKPVGHPTELGGKPGDVEADCRRFEAMGCAGADLLAYRATEADPLDLVRAARRGTKGTLVVAGSVDSPERIRALAEAGADAFTIGSAAFDGSFSPRKGALGSQLQDILAAAALRTAA
ncbi:4-hydroxythreonine-4-phosphate dehydrogenase [Pelagibius marinus]|uniref:4-hydroxythreonine-4-phosphate dehydrogenase n=1 Tax=Pelagibius marinus TaxID=2762760 RepID=UPI001D057114|nr:4-hydroxythreonine-4-phosphate dehydrogenase [Pelagibius marinus]